MPIISTWIDEAVYKQSPSLSDLWIRCIREASMASALVLYIETGEVLKGALVEVGVALASGKRVYIVGDIVASWTHHPLVTQCNSVAEAIRYIITD